MKKIFTLSSAVIFSVNVFSQAPGWIWAKGIGGTSDDGAQSIVIDDSGNIYATGAFTGTVDFDPGSGVFNLISTGQSDVFISKSDSSGNFIWAKAIGGLGPDYGTFVARDSDGNGDVCITGYFYGTVDFDPGAGIFNLTTASAIYSDIFISKLDSSGNFIWAKTMGGMYTDVGHSITFDLSGSGDVYTTGIFQGTADFDPNAGVFYLTSAGLTDIFISKLNDSGNFVWTKRMGGINQDAGSSITADSSGNVYTTGWFSGTIDFNPGAGVFNLTSIVGSLDIFISKLDSSGNFLWAKAMGGTGNDVGYFITVAPSASEGVYTTGVFPGIADFDPGSGIVNLTSAGGKDIFISKLDSSGGFVWAKRLGDISDDYGTSIIVEPEGNENVYSTGYFNGTVDFDPGAGTFNLSSAGYANIFISKLDSSGNFLWAKAMGGTSNDLGRSLAFDASGNLHISGDFNSPSISFGTSTLINTNSNGTTSDMFIAKLDSAIIAGNNQIENIENAIPLSPNPATNEIRIESGEMEIAAVEIYNVVGVKCLTQTLSEGEGVRVDVSSLAEGIYFVTVRDEKGNRVTKKFVKM